MMPSPPIDDRSKTCHSRRLATGSVQPCTDLRDCPAVAKQIRSGNMEFARSQRYAQPSFLVAPSALRQNQSTASAPPPAISCLGAFRTPAVGALDSRVMPASENLHRSDEMHFRK